MDSFSLGISGSWFIFIILTLLIVGVSIYSYYRTVPPISKNKKTLLVSLRSIGMLLLLFAIFQPVVTFFSQENIEPKVAFLFDNSESMSLEDGKGERKEVYNKVFDDIISNSNEDYPYKFEGNFEEFEYETFDSLKLDGGRTDISKPFRELNYRLDTSNMQAVVLVSDGSYNTGSNPIYAAEKLGKPIFAIGIGDTSVPVDIKVEDLITNDISYKNTPTPVFVNLISNGIEREATKVTLKANDKIIDVAEINLTKEQKRYELKFNFTPEKAGDYKVSAIVENHEDEITTKNNVKSELIKVLEDKKKIALFAGSPGYDVSFLVKELTKNENREIIKYVQRKEGDFYYKFNQKDLNESEIIILAGFPNNSTSDKYLELIKNELDRGKPLFFISSNDINYDKLKKLGNHLPFKVLSQGRNEMQILPVANKKEIGHAVLRVEGSQEDVKKWNNLPPIYRNETFFKVNPEAKVLMNYSLNNNDLNEPLIISRDLNDKRSIFIFGYGLYRWKLLGYAKEKAKGKDVPDLYSQLVNNSMRWLSIDKRFESFVLKTNKSQYTHGEQIEFFAQVYDESYLPVEDANIKVQLKSEETEEKEIFLTDIGNGQYTYKLESLPAGDYTFNGTALIEGNKIGEASGRFTVGEANPEYDDITVNYNLLKNISELTGGKVYLNSIGSLFDDLQELENFKTKNITKKEEYALWNLPLFLILSILCFGTEWLIRKLSGMT